MPVPPVKPFVRPLRLRYRHQVCGALNVLSLGYAESFARDPSFFGRAWCQKCCGYFPVGEEGEFVWEGGGERVGT